MKRSAANRFSALVAALLLLFTWTGDALGIHPCPHHSAVPAAAPAHVAAAPHGDAHAAHHGASAVSAHDQAPADHGQHGGCTCVGCCPAGAPLPTFAAGYRVAALVLPAAPRSPAVAGAELPDRFPPFTLPYGHAPPALRA